ncbi:transposase [Natronorubrum halalkaliphilum]|uniref:transposase n=1 Tax=Natronorubrum halalkaliphilum TaxID=2691917 RepID=UPI00191544A1|nr:transposase [Natronorubrum halalkaliphilum]
MSGSGNRGRRERRNRPGHSGNGKGVRGGGNGSGSNGNAEAEGGHERNRVRPHRRQFLAGVGAATGVAIAGCGDLPLIGDETATTFPAGEVDSVLRDEEPPIEWPAPVQPDSSALEGELERVGELLAEVPESIGREDVPNGVVRETIEEQRTEATTSRDEAADTVRKELYHGLRDLRDGRETARTAAVTWLAVDADEEQLVDELRDERDAVRSTVTGRLEDGEYHGSDTDDGRLRAALYFFRRETDLGHAERSLERASVTHHHAVIDIGESAGTLEFGAATAGIWEHFDERYDAAFDDGVALESPFETALERSIDRAETADFPAQDGEEWYEAVGVGVEDDQLELTVWHAGRDVLNARDRMHDALDAGNLGTGLYGALRFEQRFRAFERLRDRIADGAVAAPETVGEIRDERERALEAAAAAREQLSRPSLGEYALAETLQELAWVDDGVRRAADADPETSVSIRDEYGDYARREAELTVLPDAVDVFRARLTD